MSLSFPKEAGWIGSDHPFDLFEAYTCFRKRFGLEHLPKETNLYITADSRYKLWINGVFIARGPARSFPQHQTVDCLDIAEHLQVGTNLIAVQVYQPGYSHFAYLHRGAAGLLAHLECDDKTVLVSDLSWTTKRDPSFASEVPRVSIYGTGVEYRDLNLDETWTASDYDDTAWAEPRLVAPVGGYPWTSLHLREMPLLEERDVPMTWLESRQGTSSTNPDAHLALREGWFAAEESGLEPGEKGWINVSLEEGESAYFLFDLGRDYTCQGVAGIENAAGTEKLAVSYQEKIRNDELVISDPETYCRVRITDRFKLRAGNQTAESFTLRGGRYLIFHVTGPTGSNFRICPRARASEYPLNITKPLSTDAAELSAVIKLCETTFQACLQDSFVDCTWRESSLWLGDALPQSLIMTSLTDDIRPIKQVLEMATQHVYPDDILPSILPGEVHPYAVVDYNFSWVELLRLHFRLTQDKSFIQKTWSPLLKMLDRFHEDINEEGLLLSQPGRRLFLDWSPQSRQEPNAVYNLRYLYALQTAIELASDLGLITDEARFWGERADAIQKAIRQTFWQDGRWYDDVERTTFSQLATSLAVLTETAKPDEIEGLLESLIVRSLDLDDDPAENKLTLASPFMHHYVFEALRKHQKYDEVIAIVRQRWGRWVKQGYPTTWENWNVDFPDGSQCHAFSAHPRYHLAEVKEARGYL